MLYVKLQDPHLLSDKDTLIKKIEEKINRPVSAKDMVIINNKEQFKEVIERKIEALYTDNAKYKDTFFVSLYSLREWGETSLNIYEIEIRGDYYPLTYEDHINHRPIANVLSTRLNISISTPPKVTLNDYIAPEELLSKFRDIIEDDRLGVDSPSAILLMGVAGSGKSYAADLFAHEMGRQRVDLNLSNFIGLQDSATVAFSRTMQYILQLANEGTKIVLFIDEIEKMFDFKGGNLTSTQIFGSFLTWLQVFNKQTNNVFIVATANRIDGIIEEQPEFIRAGRFDEVLFLGYPDRDTAIRTFEYYFKKHIKELFNKYIGLRDNKEVTFIKSLNKLEGEIILHSFIEEILGDKIKDEFAKKVAVGFYPFIGSNPYEFIAEVVDKADYEYKNKSFTHNFVYTGAETNHFAKKVAHSIFKKYIENIEVYRTFDMVVENTINAKDDIIKKSITSTVPIFVIAEKGIRRQVSQELN